MRDFKKSDFQKWKLQCLIWKHTLDEINIRLDITEERSSDLEEIETEAHKPPKCQQTPNIKGMKNYKWYPNQTV